MSENEEPIIHYLKFIDQALEECCFDIEYAKRMQRISSKADDLYFEQQLQKIESARVYLQRIHDILYFIDEQEEKSQEERFGFISKFKNIICKYL